MMTQTAEVVQIFTRDSDEDLNEFYDFIYLYYYCILLSI